MNMTGEQRIAAPRQRVWIALNDPEILRASIPGCQSLEKGADGRFTATVEVKVGPIGARFKGAVSLADLNPPNGYTLMLEGNGGISGSVKGSAKVRLSEDAAAERSSPMKSKLRSGDAWRNLAARSSTRRQSSWSASFLVALAKSSAQRRNRQSLPMQRPQHRRSRTIGVPSARAPLPAISGGFPMAWILATVVAALVGFLIGRGQGAVGSDWAGVAIGLLLIVVAGAAFEYGRRSAAPVLVLDSALLRRLIDGAKE